MTDATQTHASPVNALRDFFAFYLLVAHIPFFCSEDEPFLLQLCLSACSAAVPKTLTQETPEVLPDPAPDF